MVGDGIKAMPALALSIVIGAAGSDTIEVAISP
jgi:cation transport ATPase